MYIIIQIVRLNPFTNQCTNIFTFKEGWLQINRILSKAKSINNHGFNTLPMGDYCTVGIEIGTLASILSTSFSLSTSPATIPK
jgi:hypothetical protein